MTVSLALPAIAIGADLGGNFGGRHEGGASQPATSAQKPQRPALRAAETSESAGQTSAEKPQQAASPAAETSESAGQASATSAQKPQRQALQAAVICLQKASGGRRIFSLPAG